MDIKLHKTVTAGIVLYLCSAVVLIIGGVPSVGLFGVFLWLHHYLVQGSPPSIGWPAGVFLIVQLCAFVLIVYGLVRQFMTRRVTRMTVVKDRAWQHFAVAALLAIASVSVFIGFDVWTSTKLDLMGATAHGSTQCIRDYTARYEFTTEDGQIIAAIRSHVPEGNAFVYLRYNPYSFKVKGSGRGPQVGFLLLTVLAVWQTGTAVRVLRKGNVGGNNEQQGKVRACPEP